MTTKPISRALRCLACAILVATTGCSDGTPVAFENAVEIDFYKASGISQQELANYLDGVSARDKVDDHAMYVSLQNEAGDYLIDQPVLVQWDTGEHRLMVGQSGVLQFLIAKHKLPGLKILAPAGYTHFTQQSIPLGEAYRPEKTLDTSDLPYTVFWDGRTTSVLTEQLTHIRDSGEVLNFQTFQQQMRRKHYPLELPPPPQADLTPAEIYPLRRDSVVIIGHLFEGGDHTIASGVVLDASGVVATAYHVVDKPANVVARGVMTSDGSVYAIKEILAGSTTDDVALLRIDAPNLVAAPLSLGDRVGTPVTIIAHPGSNFYSLTQGYISRYWAATYHGEVGIKMGITADFADGASGGPVFNAAGAVTGLVSSTDALGNQMVRRIAVPAQAIWDLIRSPSDNAAQELDTATLERAADESPDPQDASE